MSLTILLSIGIIVSVAAHYIGVYAEAKKTVWVTIILLWAAVISVARSEVKPKAYLDLKKMQGAYKDTDKLIKESGDKVSIYEMISIKKSYFNHKHED